MKITKNLGVTFFTVLYYNVTRYIQRIKKGTYMELIVISKTKLKIMLNEGDMRKYSIGNDTDCAEPSTRKAIRKLLDCAREQIGFNTEGEEIFVQLYTSKNGGCELFVTKTSESDTIDTQGTERKRHLAEERLLDELIPTRRASLPEKRSNSSVLLNERAHRLPSAHHRHLAYSFSSLKDMCLVCKILNSIESKIESKAFQVAGRFYLILSGASVSPYSRLDRFSFLAEYGNREDPDAILTYISEHGKEICSEKAIQTLGAYA